MRPEYGTVGVNGFSEPVWPSGKALVRLVSRRTSVRIRFGSPFSSTLVVRGHGLVTLSVTCISLIVKGKVTKAMP